jgi:hypothetical protein
MTEYSAQELLKRHGIDFIATRKGKYTTKCPKCSGGGYLNVKIGRDRVAWYCPNCRKGGHEKYEQREASGLGQPKAVYDYTDENGNRLFQTVRFEPLNGPKYFRQRTGPDQEKWSIKGVRRVLYRLPQLTEDLAAEHVIFVVEGEEDVITLRQHNVPATCNPMGAATGENSERKWRPEYNETLRGADVVICGDNDDPGREHVRFVARNLHGVARRVRVLDLVKFWAEIEESDDITDWFETGGGTVERLWEIVGELPDWTPDGNGHDAAYSFELPMRGSGRDQQPADWWRAELIDAKGLCDQKFPEIKYVVPGLFPEGVTLLASRPKIGKSWLLLQVGTAIANGVATLVANDRPLQGDVLYLALEDNKRRLQRRMRKYFGPEKNNWPARFTPAIKWRRLDQGGLQALRAWCASVERPTLIAIDTLKKVRAPKQKNQTDYDADYEACQGLQELAGEFGVAIIVAHHDRKMDAEDVFDTISGTLGLTGGVDTVAVIKRRGLAVTLHIEGRDLVETVEKAISFDRETCRWMVLGEAAEVHRSSERARVLSALAGAAEGLTTGELMGDACLRGRHAADQLLSTMVMSNEIERIKRGLYGLPGTKTKIAAAVEAKVKAKKAEKTTEIAEKMRSEPKSLKLQDDGGRSQDLSDVSGDVPVGDRRVDAVIGGFPELPEFLRRAPPSANPRNEIELDCVDVVGESSTQV